MLPTGWSVTSGTGTNSIQVTTGTAGQNGNITVTAGNSCGTSATSSLAVTVSAGTVYAGPDQYVCAGTATMAATGSGTWTQIGTTPGVATFGSTTVATTTVTLPSSGTYEFQWTGCGTSYDNIVIIRQ